MASYVDGIGMAATASAQTTAANASRNVTLGKEEFLTLLVAQLKNQDPLNPEDPTEFTAQLAQFGQLEQLMNLNTSMESLATAQNNVQKLSALSLIGKEILVESGSVQLEKEGEATSIGYTLDNTAQELTILVQNSTGKTIRTLHATELDKGTHTLTWNGMDDEGEKVKAGKYKLVLQAKSATADTSVAVTPLVRTEVTGVDLSSDGAKLETALGQFTLSAVHGVFDKDTSSNETSSALTTAAKTLASGMTTTTTSGTTPATTSATTTGATSGTTPSTTTSGTTQTSGG